MRRVLYVCGVLLSALLAACAIAPYLSPDLGRWLYLFIYPPRLVLAFAGALLLLGYVVTRRWPQVLISAALTLTLLAELPWATGVPPDVSKLARGTSADGGPSFLRVLSFNIKDSTNNAKDLGKLAVERQLDLLFLQEVKPPNRSAFVAALPGYDLYWGNPAVRFEHDDWGPLSSLIAVRRGRGIDVAGVLTGMTGYRTFALRAQYRGAPLWLVNVHTTKAFWFQGGIGETLRRADYKSAWHAGERVALSAWLRRRRGEAVLIAGDFNAPAVARATRFEGFQNAQVAAGRGLHVTFPSWLPVWDIDHMLGSRTITFLRYERLFPGYSDHAAQLAALRVDRQPGAQLTAM